MKIQHNVLLARYSTFGIGGKAAFFVEVKNEQVLREAIRWAREKDLLYKVFAGGSNMVFPDQGFPGLVIRLCFAGMRIVSKERVIFAGAGVLLRDVIRASISKGWGGLETLSGIPGTIGGAVYGNAGAYGQSVSCAVRSVSYFDTTTGETNSLLKDKCGFAYRHSIFKERPFFILGVFLEFKSGEKKALQKITKDIIAAREKKYKPGLKCPGSFFKNVLVADVSLQSLALVDSSKIIDGKIPAGWLLEQVGAKGVREGGVYIADFHGNLFVNDGHGTARDVKTLAVTLKKKVLERFGIELEEEVRYF